MLFGESSHDERPSALIGETLPAFELANLMAPSSTITPKTMVGRVSLLNVWATWCAACKIEHPMLMRIKEHYHIPIFAINYKDDREKAMTWLRDQGNPYLMIASDQSGDTATDLGVYGTPETFVISKAGKIVYRHFGIINQHEWDHVLYPLIKKYEQATDDA